MYVRVLILRVVLTAAILPILFPSQAISASLKPETVAAWKEYTRNANAAMQDRIRSNSFLWTFENPERSTRVRNGEIVVEPISEEVPRKVPGGLIHHWIGSVHLPGATLDDVIAITRDYDRYKDIYHPSVIDSKTVARGGIDDSFSMLLMNKALFMKTALDADYETTTLRLGTGRAYSVSSTKRVQEIDEFGRAHQHRLPEGEGGGYIWKLFSIARFEQRDGGVYVELEALALSRDVPTMMHFVVDPVVRRISRNSLFTSLRQTAEAAKGTTGTAASSKAPASPSVFSLHGSY